MASNCFRLLYAYSDPNLLCTCALLAQKPATLDEAVERLVATRLGEERAALAAEYLDREAALAARVAALEALVSTGKPGAAAGAGSTSSK
jgi:hypothetical protein